MQSEKKNSPVTNCKITLNITLKTELPENDELFITGNLPELGEWDPAGTRLKCLGNSKYSIDLLARKSSIIEFKITRGSWRTQGIFDLEDIPPSNFVIKVKGNQKINIEILDWLDQQVLESDPVLGTLVNQDGFACKGLKHKRDIQVWLPDTYRKKGKPAAVIYMHDGQNLFEPATSFAGVDWKVDEVITAMIARKELPACIVVGIPNSPDRMQELNLFSKTGKAYANFVVNEVKPWVDKNFNVNPAPEATVIMGSSMGGLMAFQMALAFSNVFGRAGCLSSAFQKTNGRIFKQLNESQQLPMQSRFYLDTGEYEPPITEIYFEMMQLMVEKGYVEGQNLMGYFDEQATHCEAAWAKRLDIPLKFLLGKN